MVAQRLRDSVNPDTGQPWTPRGLEQYNRHLRSYGYDDPAGARETLLDLPGAENVHGLGNAAANLPGPGKEVIRRALIERMRGARGAGGGRVGAAPAQVEGAPRRLVAGAVSPLPDGRAARAGGARYARAARQMIDDLRAQTGPVFRAVSQRKVDPNLFRTAFFELFEDPNVGRYWKRLARSALRGVRGQAGRRLQRALGALADGRMPADDDITIGLLHRLRRGLNDEIGAAVRAGENELASDLTQLRRDYFDAWIRDSGEPGDDLLRAINTYADTKALERAREAGESVFRMSDGEFWALVDGASEPERAAMVIGAVRHIQRLAGRFETGRPAIREILRPDNRERLRAIWPTDARGSDQPFERFLYRVMREHNMLETYNRTLAGSRTTPLREEIADATVRDGATSEILDGVENAIRHGRGPRQIAADQIANAFNRARNPGLLNEATNRGVAELLTTPLSPAGTSMSGQSVVTQRLREELARQRLSRALARGVQRSPRSAAGLPVILNEQVDD